MTTLARGARFCAVFAAIAGAVGCDPGSSPQARKDPAAGASAAAPASAVVAPEVRRVELSPAPAGEVTAAVVRARSEAEQHGRSLLVYVGARWCEPCRYFHDAAENNRLPPDFPLLTLLEFDLDRDEQRLKLAGYQSTYIPLFAKPNADGRSSGKQIEGSIKGPGAVNDIAPRLRALVSDAAPK